MRVKKVDKDKAKLSDGTLIFDKYRDVDDIYYTALSEKLQTGSTTDRSWLSQFVNKNLDKVMHSEDSLGAMREVKRAVNATAQYINNKNSYDTDQALYFLQRDLFPWQKKVYEDSNNKIAMLCGRRAGKSFTVARLAIKHCLTTSPKKRQAAIIGLTVERTASLYWDLLRDTLKSCHINAHIDNGAYRITFTNGNFIQIFGNSSKLEREKLRGFDISFAAVDEMQSQQGLYYLLVDILGPMIKGQGGTTVVLGTAPISAGTLWENIIADDTYSHYHATMEDNPTIPDHQHALQDVLNSNQWTPDNITFRREYLGEIAYDTERMIYPKRSYYEEDFKNVKSAWIGIDYGWADYSSFAPILVTDNGAYLWHEWKQNKTPASQLVDKAKSLVEEIHKTFNIPNEDIHLIADTSHQQVSSDIYNQGLTNIQNAYKLDESYQIARVAEALSIGDLKIRRGGYFDAECDSLVWKWDADKQCIIYQIDDATFHPEIADSVKYAWNTYLTSGTN